MESRPQQAANADDLILRHILIEVFQAGQRSGCLLHLVEDRRSTVGSILWSA